MFCRVCAFYGLGDRQVLEMPVRRFWLMAANVSRLMAERDMRALTVFGAAQSSDGSKQTQERLNEEMGSVARVVERFDPAGFERLKGMT